MRPERARWIYALFATESEARKSRPTMLLLGQRNLPRHFIEPAFPKKRVILAHQVDR
jgi:hypothetical protein